MKSLVCNLGQKYERDSGVSAFSVQIDWRMSVRKKGVGMQKWERGEQRRFQCFVENICRPKYSGLWVKRNARGTLARFSEVPACVSSCEPRKFYLIKPTWKHGVTRVSQIRAGPAVAPATRGMMLNQRE